MTHSRFWILATVFWAVACPGARSPAAADPTSTRNLPPVGGILYNEDDSNRFVLDPPGQMKPQRLDRLVDELADSHVSAMLICCCAKNTGYHSKVWDVHSKGFDPAKDNQQPYFGDTPREDRETLRRWAHNLQAMLDAGIDPMQRMIDRCRLRHISPWVSIRMNDVHDAHLRNSPLHSRFWKEHPEYRRYPNRFAAWNDRCLNYGLKPVRDHAMALIEEVCRRYDMDGLELDWNRFPLHFREGEEASQGKVLTEWMGEVRRVVREAEKKWKHPIRLVARVPARPEVAVGTGLDAVTWAKRGLVDHLVVAPFWATTDFDIPVERWREQLQGTGVGVTAGLEIRIQPYPGGPVLDNTPERRRGAAMAMLARGSQGIYLFNYFDVGSQLPGLLAELDCIETLAGKDRSYVVAYTDISIPAKPIPAALPAKIAPGRSAAFRLYIGPKPLPAAQGEVELTLKAENAGEKPDATVLLNGQATNAGKVRNPEAFCDGYNTVTVTNAGRSALSVQRVELSIRFPKKK
jgi:hypothetical protein